ncbi:MAG: hypothetical protein FWH23_01350 [Bacteroidales bacterium]|nr:hypothetical protein [Bacteroidales bacterium]
MDNNLISRNLEQEQNEMRFDRLNINFARNFEVMRKIAIILSVLALIASSCGNKKVPFDYSTLPTEWTMLTEISDENFVVCEGEKEMLIIEENTLTRLYIAVGEQWRLEILEAYQVGETVIFNVKSSDGHKYELKFVWVNKEKGLAQWIFDESDFGTFVAEDKVSEYPKLAKCFADEEEYLPTVAVNPEDFVLSEEIVFTDELIPKKIVGDLNKDGKEDCVIITKQTKKEFASVENSFSKKVDRNRRGILIAFRKDDGWYEKVLAIPNCFLSENEDGGIYFAPELSVEILNGNLRVNYGHGRYGWWRYTFRYQNNNFELIGYDTEEMSSGRLERGISINFLAKKKQTKTYDEDENMIEEIWQNIEIKNLVKLTDIDFDEFSVSSCYTEK